MKTDTEIGTSYGHGPRQGVPYRPALEAARKYIAGVNADCPPGTDDDRDELLEQIDIALAQPPSPASDISHLQPGVHPPVVTLPVKAGDSTPDAG